jgi:hypothetical protein
LVIDLYSVRDFLDLIGEVGVEVKTAFIDTQYPRAGVDIRVVSDPSLLYETVSFAAGWVQLDSEQAIKFMRSRHAEGSEGNDYARSTRQQQVLQAVVKKVGGQLLSELKRYDFSLLAMLYNFYLVYFEDQLPFVELMAFGHVVVGQGSLPEVKMAKLAVAPGESEAYLREKETRTEWKLEVVDWGGLVREVHEKLGLEFSI